ncbi:uncharacterized protein LOC144818757 isoform X2 [Lissotriton helveticus]
MPPQNSDKVTFQDVAACFSEEEWKLLHEWQKELYTNVMKEIHQALASLGPLIAASVFSLSTKEKDDVCHMDYSSPERRHSNNHSPSEAIINAEVLFRTKIEETQRPNNSRDKGRVRNDSFSTGYPFHNPNICLRKEELSNGLTVNQGAEVGECCVSPSSDFPFLNTDLCLRKEGRSDIRALNFPVAAAVERSTVPPPEHGSIPGVFPIHIKEEEEEEEEESYSDNQQENTIIRCTTSPTGVASINRQKEVEEPMQFSKNSQPCGAILETNNASEPQSCHNRTDFTSQLGSERYWEPRGERTMFCERDFSNLMNFSVHQPRSKLGLPLKNKECESNPTNITVLHQPTKQKQSQTPYKCTECDERYDLKGELIRHMKTHAGVRPYACTYCERSFFRKANLLSHYTTHTGDKPYMCSFCHKRFNRKYNLNGHVRIHTGERPYKCTECDRSFIWKGDLNQHRRKHTL